jgi:hypothetical protein
MSNIEVLKTEFLPKYLNVGSDRFYHFLIMYALNKLVYMEKGTYKGVSPEVELLEYYDQFLILFRREGDQVYLDLARVFRRASHKIYRSLLKKKMIEKSHKFLQLVI